MTQPRPLTEVTNRISRVKRIPARDLHKNPDNWRTHGESQQEAIQVALRDIGFVAPVIAREMDDGSLMLLDGHARVAQVAPDVEIPVAVIRCSDAEAAMILASLDPIAAMAGTDQAALDRLLTSLRTADSDYDALLKLLADGQMPLPVSISEDVAPSPQPEADFEPTPQIGEPAPFMPEVSGEDIQKAQDRVTKQASKSQKDIATITCPHCGSDISFEPGKLV